MTQRTDLTVMAGLPAYNEANSVGSIVLLAKQYADRVVVVDDGSTDNTAVVAELAGATVIRHEKQGGYGAAIQTILAEARRLKPDVLVVLDADSQHNPEEIPLLIKPISNGFDLVIGSRQAQRHKTPIYRRIGQRVLARSSRLVSKHSVYDSESGFRALSSKAIAELDLQEKGFAAASEMIVSAANKKLRIIEVPISNIYVADGSTMNPFRHGMGILNWILVMISHKRPLFFFGLSGAALLAVSLVIGLRVVSAAMARGEILVGSAILTVMFAITGILSVFTGIILNTIGNRR